MSQELLFSVTKKDFEIQTFRVGGHGGQHRDKTETGVRIIHKASGARGEARDSRSREQNKKNAFRRLIASKKFKVWLKLETAKRLGQVEDIDKKVDKMMQPENLKIEML